MMIKIHDKVEESFVDKIISPMRKIIKNSLINDTCRILDSLISRNPYYLDEDVNLTEPTRANPLPVLF